MACMTMLPSFDEVMYLISLKDDYYKPLTLSSKNAIDFEIRHYEMELCDRMFDAIYDNLLEDPQNILWEERLSLEWEKEYFKHNKKRIRVLDKLIQVLNILEIELKCFRGEQNCYFK